MKSLIYDPYLDTLGGGERYCLTVAECLLKKGWQVDLFWDSNVEIKRAIERFNLKIRQIGLVGKRPTKLSLWEKFKLERHYDLIFWLSDGSIPFLWGKKNILHFQVPFITIKPRTYWQEIWLKIKLRRIKAVVCNSQFTKQIIDRQLGVGSLVLYPPVDVEKFALGKKKKENIILAVGRFEETMQAKKQDILIKAFRKMVDGGLKGWRLVLVGGSLANPRENKFLQRLKQLAAGYPIDFAVNAPFEQLQDYYRQAKIFWHAAGYGVDEKKQPYKVEHFGMTAVEAMAAGCVPVVIDKGGLREIVRRGVGERWRSVTELIEKTEQLIKSPARWRHYSSAAIKKSRDFSKQKFCWKLEQIIK